MSAKPGLIRDAIGSMEVELRKLLDAGFGAFVSESPDWLSIGAIKPEEGIVVKSFFYVPHALERAPHSV